ncbi:MAG: HNH endonuclease [bacterium]
MNYQTILKQYSRVALDTRKISVIERAVDAIFEGDEQSLTTNFKRDVIKAIVRNLSKQISDIKEIQSLKSDAIREAILKRDKRSCVFCGKLLTLQTIEIDHDIPRGRGGTDHPANLQATCRRCNREKGQSTSAEYRLEIDKATQLVFTRNASKAMMHRGIDENVVMTVYRKGACDRPCGNGVLVREGEINKRRIAIQYKRQGCKAKVLTVYLV